MHGRNRDRDVGNKIMATMGAGGRGINYGIGSDVYTLLCTAHIINETLLYKPYSMLCGDLNGQDIKKRGDACTHRALLYSRN